MVAALTLLFISISPWMTLLGGSIYWQLWVFYLPFVTFLFIANRLNDREILFAVLIFSLLKILFTGFEFITTFFLMMSVPFVYFAVKDFWPPSAFFKKAICFIFGSISAVLTGLMLLAIQISFVDGNFASALKYLWFAFGKRTFETGQTYTEPYASAIKSNVFDVIKKYLDGPVFARPFTYASAVEPAKISYTNFIFWFIIFSILIFIMKKAWSSTEKSVARPLLAVTWYSIFAPLSWFVIFKAHAYIHISLDFMVWNMPFMLFGIALVGYAVLQMLEKMFETLAHGDLHKN
ncbi:MAG: hypothetical protein Kow002_04800 [Anaerolineales bacterium]